MSGIAEDLGLYGSRSREGGGRIWLVPYDAAKEPYQPHASLAAAAAATATTLTCFRAPAADTHVPVSFGSSGDLNIDIFAQDGAAEEKAFSALAANAFTISALTTARKLRAVVKLKDTDDYTITDWKCLGELGGTDHNDGKPVNDHFNEIGDLINSWGGNRTVEIVTTLKQTSKHEVDFLTKVAPDAYYALKYAVPVGADGMEIIVAKKVQIIHDMKRRFELGQPRVIPVTIKLLVDGANEPYVEYEG